MLQRVTGNVARFWSRDGPDQEVLRALEERRFGDLPRAALSPGARRDQLAGELGTV